MPSFSLPSGQENRQGSSREYNQAPSTRDGSLSGNQNTSSGKLSGREGKDRFLDKVHKMTGWFSTSEPSVQALKRHKKVTFEKAGVAPNDPEASSKLHYPIGEIPADAVKPAGRGPDPEELARAKAEKRRARSSGSTASRVSHSSSSEFSERSSLKSPSYPVYRDRFPYD